MPPIANMSATSHPAWNRTVVLAGKNLGQMAKDLGFNILDNPTALKENALILSSAALVLSRIAVAYNSALQARGTSEARHRQNEFIKTSIREIGGYTLSFLVFRTFQIAMRKAIEKVFGLSKQYTVWIWMREHFGHVRRETMAGREVPKCRPFLNPDSRMPTNTTKMVNAYQRFGFDEIASTLGRKEVVEISTAERIVKIFSRVDRFKFWFPIIIGAIPAFALSGFWLENLTQNHSSQIANRVANYWNKRKSGRAEGTATENEAKNKHLNHNAPATPTELASNRDSLSHPGRNFSPGSSQHVYSSTQNAFNQAFSGGKRPLLQQQIAY